LQRLGTVLHVSSHRNLIIRGEFFPKLNSTVLTKRLKKIGSIYDVFGPIKSPFLSVRPFKDVPLSSLTELAGEKVYV
jgi:RNA-binding protein